MIRLYTSLLAIVLLSITFSTLSAVDYTVDKSHSRLMFKVKHFTFSDTHGHFNDMSGSISFDPKKLATSSVSISSKVSSIDTDDKKRDTHLKSAEFLDAGIFPTISFKGTGFSALADTANTYNVTGILSLHGVNKKIMIQVTYIGEGQDPWGNYRIGFTSTFKISRKDYGITQHTKSVGDEITLTIACEAIKNK